MRTSFALFGVSGALAAATAAPAATTTAVQQGYAVRATHPRLFIDELRLVVERCAGPLAGDYMIVKERADRAVRNGIEFIGNRFAVPEDLMNLGLAYLIERARGAEAQPYVDAILKQWGDGTSLQNKAGTHFGYHAIAFDWIHDALTAEQRVLYGDALGSWLRWYTNRPEITLRNGHWEYNQTWGPAHLNVMHSRDAITQKLLIALAIVGAGTRHEADAKAFLDSWHQRIPAECVPAFDRMGGVWSESMGHGAYGPVTVIPWAFHVWRTATGIDLFKQVKPWGFPVEMPRWVAYTMVPHNDRTAWIDDGSGGRPGAFVAAAPMLRDPLAQYFSDRGRDWGRSRWERVAAYDPAIAAEGPETLPLGYLFPGAGHVYSRSAWGDPNATWAFFGAGPQFAGHSRDDEGHFMISKRGALVSRAGGQGGNEDDYYVGGSLVYNLVTIFDPDEKFRRDRGNENDGGLLRHVYEGGPWPRERGSIVAFEHGKDFTYAAADLTKGYSAHKSKEVTRQFLYLRGAKEYFIVFDRVEATKLEFARHWFLHVPTEPQAAGRRTTWLSLPEADGDRTVLSQGRSRAFLHALLPADAAVTVRGGPGQDAWGHPLEPKAQYNHEAPARKRPPICPWRIEVAAPAKGARTHFLHVLEIADEGTLQPAEMELLEPAGVKLADGRQIRFNAAGPLGGSVDGTALASAVRIENQYSGAAPANAAAKSVSTSAAERPAAPRVNNPVYRPNTVFTSHEDLRSPKFEEIRVKYRLDDQVRNEPDEFMQILRLRHWLHRHVVVSKTGPELPETDACRTLEEGPRGGRYSCGHMSAALNAVLNAQGYVSRIVLSGAGEKEPKRLTGSHGSNEVWSNSLRKWVLVDAEHDSHFERAGVPLSALEVRDEVLRDGAKSVVRVRGLERKPEPRGEDESWGLTPRTYTWISWPTEGNRFTLFPADPGGFQAIYDDEYSRTHTWYRSGKPHWAYAAQRFKRVAERAALEWTPNVVDATVRVRGDDADVAIVSSTPNLREYQMKRGEGDWERVEEKFTLRGISSRERILLRAVNLRGICGPEHRLSVGPNG